MLIRSNGAPLLVTWGLGRESCILWRGFKYQTVAGEIDNDEDDHEDDDEDEHGEADMDDNDGE